MSIVQKVTLNKKVCDAITFNIHKYTCLTYSTE